MTRPEPMRPEPAITFDNRGLSITGNRPQPRTGNPVAGPILLVRNEVSPFLRDAQLLLFSEDPRNAPQIDEPELRRKEAQMAVKCTPESTRRAYESDLKSFHSFCRRTGRAACPASPGTITLYMDWLATQGLTAATISRRLWAISREHEAQGHPTPCEQPEVRRVVRAVRRSLGTAQKAKAPIWAADLKAMLEAAGDGTRALRDRALLVTGFASGVRRGELVALDLCDVTTESQGFRIRISRSKTDQEAAGAEVGVHRGQHKATCPVRILQEWIAKRGRQPGPLFSAVRRSGEITGKRLSGSAVARIVKRAVKSVGLDPVLYAGHSMRRGCASSASAAGADILAIKARMRHKSIKTTEKYVDYASVFAVNPLKGVL